MLSVATSFVHLNGKLLNKNETRSPPELLRELPNGAYTSLRVENLTHVLDWHLHVERLNRSVNLLSRNQPDVYPHLRQVNLKSKKLDWAVAKNLQSALADVKTMVASPSDIETSQSVVILITDPAQAESEVCNVYTNIRHKVGPREIVPVKVWIQGKGRDLPEAKFSKWITDRIPLETTKPASCQEVVLNNEKEGLLEGLTSNFYVIKNNENGLEIQTAGLDDGILAGTFQAVLLDTIKRHFPKVKINRSCPMLHESSSWKEAFISNSVTGIRPIQEILLQDGVQNIVFKDAPGPLTTQFIELADPQHERTLISDLTTSLEDKLSV